MIKSEPCKCGFTIVDNQCDSTAWHSREQVAITTILIKPLDFNLGVASGADLEGGAKVQCYPLVCCYRVKTNILHYMYLSLGRIRYIKLLTKKNYYFFL
jgi:hypothetical protein